MKWRTKLLAAAVAYFLGTIALHAQAEACMESGHAVITEYLTPSQPAFPQGLDLDSRGDTWYVETSAGKIAVLRHDQTTAEYALPNGGQPFTLKLASDGIWFTDNTNHAIGHLDPVTASIEEFAIPSNSKPLFIQVAADGSKWFTEESGVGRLAADGTMSEWSVTLEHSDDNVEQLSIDPDGNVWFTERNFDGLGAAGTNKVRRLDPRNNVMSTYLVPTFGGNPAGVYANPDGTIWVSEYYANAFALLFPRLARHTDEIVAPNLQAGESASTAAPPAAFGRQEGAISLEAAAVESGKAKRTRGWIEYPIPTANTEAEDMRVDRLGRLWYEGDAGFMGVLDPLTEVFTQYEVPTPDSGYYNIALDAKSGTLWFAEAASSGAVPSKVGKLNVWKHCEH